jgi:ectoine hydroxylase-related dioxygenase (phytanoyl-CoA dioxygenase family)
MNAPTPPPHRVTSNGREIPDTPRYLVAAPDSTELLGDRSALRERYHRDGFVILRNVVDPDEVRALRGEYFSAFPAGYLVAGSDPAEGRFSGRRPPDLPSHGVEGHPAHAFVRSERFARFVASISLAELVEVLLESPVTVLPRLIMRHFDSSVRRASRAHADFSYLDQGSERVVTAWIPLGDVPRATGGLVYQAGSHLGDPARLDALRAVHDRPTDSRPLSHDLAWVAEQMDSPWSWTDYRAGDVALHSPRVVHASLDTTTEAMRASIDARFLALGERTDPRWLRPWSGDDGN